MERLGIPSMRLPSFVPTPPSLDRYGNGTTSLKAITLVSAPATPYASPLDRFLDTAPIKIGCMIINEMCQDGVTIPPIICNDFGILLAPSATSRRLAGIVHCSLKNSTFHTYSYQRMANFLQHLRPDLTSVVRQVRVQRLLGPFDSPNLSIIFAPERSIKLVEMNQNPSRSLAYGLVIRTLWKDCRHRGIEIRIRLSPRAMDDPSTYQRGAIIGVSRFTAIRIVKEDMKLRRLQDRVRVPLVSNTGGGYKRCDGMGKDRLGDITCADFGEVDILLDHLEVFLSRARRARNCDGLSIIDMDPG